MSNEQHDEQADRRRRRADAAVTPRCSTMRSPRRTRSPSWSGDPQGPQADPGRPDAHVTAHDYDRGGKPDIAWDEEVARDQLLSALVADALQFIDCLPVTGLDNDAERAVAWLALAPGGVTVSLSPALAPPPGIVDEK